MISDGVVMWSCGSLSMRTPFTGLVLGGESEFPCFVFRFLVEFSADFSSETFESAGSDGQPFRVFWVCCC